MFLYSLQEIRKSTRIIELKKMGPGPVSIYFILSVESSTVAILTYPLLFGIFYFPEYSN